MFCLDKLSSGNDNVSIANLFHESNLYLKIWKLCGIATNFRANSLDSIEHTSFNTALLSVSWPLKVPSFLSSDEYTTLTSTIGLVLLETTYVKRQLLGDQQAANETRQLLNKRWLFCTRWKYDEPFWYASLKRLFWRLVSWGSCHLGCKRISKNGYTSSTLVRLSGPDGGNRANCSGTLNTMKLNKYLLFHIFPYVQIEPGVADNSQRWDPQ